MSTNKQHTLSPTAHGLLRSKEVGDQPGRGEAIEYHTECLAIGKEVGDRAGEGMAYGNLGSAYDSQRIFSKAIEYHTQCLTIEKYGRLGNEYQSQGAGNWHILHTTCRKERTRRTCV